MNYNRSVIGLLICVLLSQAAILFRSPTTLSSREKLASDYKYQIYGIHNSELQGELDNFASNNFEPVSISNWYEHDDKQTEWLVVVRKPKSLPW